MDKMQPMSNPIGGDDNNNTNGLTDAVRGTQSATSDPTNSDNGEDIGEDIGDESSGKLTSHMENQKLQDHLINKRLGGERDEFGNRVSELAINKKKNNLVSEESILDKLKIFVPPRITDYTTLTAFLQTHIVELRFTRRNPKADATISTTRKMVCTANWRFLSNMFTRRMFKWKTPKSRRGISWYKRRNLIIVWDLMIQGFRMIPVGNITFISAFKCTSLMEKGRFLLFYRKNVRNLHPSLEKKYFNS